MAVRAASESGITGRGKVKTTTGYWKSYSVAQDWFSRTSNISGTINTFSYGGGTYIAAGSSGALSSSTNGITWTARTSGFSTSEIFGSSYGLGIFVVVGASGKIATSTNGTTWTSRTSNATTTSSLYAVVFDGSGFVGTGTDTSNNNPLILNSTDGVTWTTRTAGYASSRFIVYGRGLYAIDNPNSATGYVSTSTNSVTWTSRATGISYTNALQFGGGTFVATNSNTELSTSTNGTTWTSRTPGFGVTGIRQIAYGASRPYAGRFVATSYGTGTTRSQVTTSTDGITWTSRSFSSAQYIVAAGYGNGLFLAGGLSGALATASSS